MDRWPSSKRLLAYPTLNSSEEVAHGEAQAAGLMSRRSPRRALREGLHQLLKVRGRIVEGDTDSVGPNDALLSRNALATNYGGRQSSSLGFTRNVQAQSEFAPWFGVEVSQQQEPAATRVLRNSAASLLTCAVNLGDEVYRFAWKEPLVFD